jgi:hypothetical protein
MKIFKIFLIIYLIISSESSNLSYEKIKILESLKALSSPTPKTSSEISLRKSIDPITAAALIVAAVCALYKVGVFLFGYHKSEVYYDIPMERGFSYFESKATVAYFHDVEEKNILLFKKRFLQFLDITTADKENYSLMDDLFSYIKFQEMGGWGKQDILYQTKEKKHEVRYASVVASKDKNEKGKTVYHFLIMTTSATFKLAKTLRMKVTHSGFGVVANKLRSKIIEKPTAITQSDLDSIVQFYNFVCLKAMAKYFGVKYDLPKLKKK